MHQLVGLSDHRIEQKQAARDACIKTGKAHIVLSPTEQQVLEGFRNIVHSFEATVGETALVPRLTKSAVLTLTGYTSLCS